MAGSPRPDITVLTATPDLLAQGLVPALVKALDQHGVSVVAALPLAFSAAKAAELYGGRLTHDRRESRLHAAWLNPRLFTAGSSLILYLAANAPEEPLVDLIRRIKGSSRIGERGPGALRSLSPLADRGFSLVHSPDDADGVRHEISVVLGSAEAAAVQVRERPALSVEVVTAIAPCTPLAAETRPFDVLPRAIAQVAAMCACAPLNAGIAAPAHRLLEGVQAFRRDLAKWPVDRALERRLWRGLAKLGDVVDALGDAHRLQQDNRASPMDLRRWLRTAELLSVVASAVREADFTPVECEALLEAMTACHLPLSSWDEHRLRLISAYHRKAEEPARG